MLKGVSQIGDDLMNEEYFAGNPVQVGQETQLLLDELAYEDRWDVERRLNCPERCPKNPVLMADQPWETNIGGPSVLYDKEAQLFRMWYALYDSGAYGYQYNTNRWDPQVHGSPYMVSYAESTDGINWTKPLSDRHAYKGYKRTNIVLKGQMKAQGFRVSFAPAHMRDRGRFMLTYRDNIPEQGGNQLLLYFSNDGVEWFPFSDNPIYQGALDTEHSLLYDDKRQRWFLHTRPRVRSANPNAMIFRENVKARIAVTFSKDLKNWSKIRTVLCPDELDGQFFFDHMLVEKYQNRFLGFLAVHPRDGDASGHIELVSSEDGLNWHRNNVRMPFLSPGSAGSWDAGHVWQVKNIVPVGDWLYMYYAGTTRPWRVRYPENSHAIGMARICRDRFAGQFADINGGFLLSRELKVAGNRLLINCSTVHRAFNRKEKVKSELAVELLDHTAQPITGYTFEDCDAININALEHPVSWKGKADISALHDQTVYIRFFIKDTYLFAFRFSNQ